jgi:alanyl-tRNA synthetase
LKLKSSRTDIPVKIEKLILQSKEFEKKINELKAQLLSGSNSVSTANEVIVDGVKYYGIKLKDADIDSLRNFSDSQKLKLGSGIVIAASAGDGKASFIVAVTKDLVSKGYHAGKIAKNFSVLIGGSGGGKEEFAQGGGKDPSRLDGALESIKKGLR